MIDFYKNNLLSLSNMALIEMTICLNDDAEILVRLKPKLPDKILKAFDKEMKRRFHEVGVFDDDQKNASSNEEKSFFYFFPNPNIENIRA